MHAHLVVSSRLTPEISPRHDSKFLPYKEVEPSIGIGIPFISALGHSENAASANHKVAKPEVALQSVSISKTPAYAGIHIFGGFGLGPAAGQKRKLK